MADDDRIEEEDQASQADEPEAQEPEATEGEPSGTGAPPPEMDVFDMLRAAVGLFVQEAWIALGLQPRPGAGETTMDLRCAKIAIDTTAMLIEQLGGEALPDEKREFDRALTDLRVNFMKRKSRGEPPVE